MPFPFFWEVQTTLLKELTMEFSFILFLQFDTGPKSGPWTKLKADLFPVGLNTFSHVEEEG